MSSITAHLPLKTKRHWLIVAAFAVLLAASCWLALAHPFTSGSTKLRLYGASAAALPQVDLKWTASTDDVGVKNYQVFRNGSLMAEPTSTAYTDTNTSPNTTYSYSVKAVDLSGNIGQASNVATVTTAAAGDTTAPASPTGLKGTAASPTQVNLSWTASSDNVAVAQYVVLRNGAVIATPTGTSYSDTSAVANTSYSYQVEAKDTSGNASSPSTAVSVKTPAASDTTAPQVPSGLMASAPGSNQVNLTWTASSDTGGSGLAGYNIYRNGAKVATSTTSTYGDGTVAASTTYSYTVSAYDAAGNTSAQATAVSVTTPGGVASIPGQCASGGTYLWSNLATCGWPDASNTGVPAGTTLKTAGSQTISTNGAVIDGEQITGQITVTAQNVTIKNSKILATGPGGGGSGAIYIRAGASATISNVEINGQNNVHACVWHEGNSVTIRNVNCHGSEDGFFAWAGSSTTGDNFTIENNYIHDLTAVQANGHHDGFQTEGASNGYLHHNTIDMPASANSAVSIWDSLKSSANIRVEDNLMTGGGFTAYAEDYNPSESNPVGGFTVTNVTFTNNKFSTRANACVGSYGTWFHVSNAYSGAATDGWHRSGNVVLETGENIDTTNPHNKGSLCN